ncbi:hypothetical protein Acsp03_69470 [Actinomadura sp. NBRC 104412]|uniref:bifunctional phosphatase PAP2/O-acyltransferase family protein n=1 Tax=Actinomadura sp. NBRC 104412 TaxID=3032203 RepID=UPI0024A13942|nr:phosphatase PAP2 family protein [Actinomadura sp. NBRC 104412]GLZ09481.1 hypothetical protein Acsp03_69470 [Actinomadura sp. NBRC 104412]
MAAGVSVSLGASPVGDAVSTRLSLRRELALGLAVFAVYAVVDSMPVTERTAVAEAHGRDLHALEKLLHLDLVTPANRWLSSHPAVATVANYEYATSYVISALIMLGYLYRRRPGRYPVARNSFALINLIGVACFALYPVMPPRLLSGLGFVDTVKQGGTWGSWGTPLIDNANQLAAMPSLHVAWALWVSVELSRISARRGVQAASLLHVLVTVLVTVATANHYLLDAAGAAVLVLLCNALAERLTAGRRARRAKRARRLRPPDSFFLAVERPGVPQHVGGVILLDDEDGTLDRQRMVGLVRQRLGALPRFRQRPGGSGLWRHAVWDDHPDIDWDWHIVERRLPEPGGQAALERLVAELEAEPLPKDRPLWQIVLVPGYAPGRSAVVFLMHHAVADGSGVVAHALRLVEPEVAPVEGGATTPGPRGLRRAAGVALGLLQLATERRQGMRLPSHGTGERRFGSFELPLDEIRSLARSYGVRVSDVLLCAVAGGLSRVSPACEQDTAEARRLRVTVPLMMRTPSTPPEGNYTAAVMADLPIGAMPEPDRLAAIARDTRRLHSGTRALASWFVMRRAAALLPAGLHRAFSRTVYGDRIFQAVVTNLPGLDTELTLAGKPIHGVQPLVPPADGAPLAVGALSWRRRLHFGVTADPVVLEDAGKMAAAMRDVIGELAEAVAARAGRVAERQG